MSSTLFKSFTDKALMGSPEPPCNGTNWERGETEFSYSVQSLNWPPIWRSAAMSETNGASQKSGRADQARC